MKYIKLPHKLYISPGIAMVACPLCGYRPFFYVRMLEPQRVRCPVTGERYTIGRHYQFSVGCNCNPFPYFWGPDLWNTAKAWRKRWGEIAGSGTHGQFITEQYTGKQYEGIRTMSEVEFKAKTPLWMACLSPDDTGQQPLPSELGPEGMYYPTLPRIRKGVLF